jgi:hypothetical protein
VPFEGIELAFEHFEDSFARSTAPVSCVQDLGEFGQCESKAESVPDHVYAFGAAWRIYAVTRGSPWRFGQYAEPLVVP